MLALLARLAVALAVLARRLGVMVRMLVILRAPEAVAGLAQAPRLAAVVGRRDLDLAALRFLVLAQEVLLQVPAADMVAVAVALAVRRLPERKLVHLVALARLG